MNSIDSSSSIPEGYRKKPAYGSTKVKVNGTNVPAYDISNTEKIEILKNQKVKILSQIIKKNLLYDKIHRELDEAFGNIDILEINKKVIEDIDLVINFLKVELNKTNSFYEKTINSAILAVKNILDKYRKN